MPALSNLDMSHGNIFHSFKFLKSLCHIIPFSILSRIDLNCSASDTVLGKSTSESISATIARSCSILSIVNNLLYPYGSAEWLDVKLD